jgi:nucleotide-binding universal stress UspA family protein
MSIKDVLVPVIALLEDECALALAEQIATRFSARAAALIVAVHPGSSYADEVAPLSEVLEDFTKRDGSAAAQRRANIAAWLARHAPAFETRHALAAEAAGEKGVVAHARFADLTVLARAEGHAMARRSMLESVLFHSGRPVLLVPEQWRADSAGERILIAWKPTREAVRAVHDALPLLRAAGSVSIVTVDAVPSPRGYGEAPGCDLAAHLARHSVEVEVRHVDGLGRGEARALQDEAHAIGADLMVLGAYGHSRMEQMIFGGVTRELLNQAELPLFISH